MKLVVYLLWCLTGVCAVDAANILMLFPIPSPSHHILGDELAKALVKRGHHITMISPYKTTGKSENYTEIVLEELLEYKKHYMDKILSFNSSKIETVYLMTKQDALAKLILESSKVQDLLKSKKNFDIIVLEITMCESLLGLSHFYNAPYVVVHSLGSFYTVDTMVGNSQPYAYVPIPIGDFTDEMTLLERVKNTAISLVMNILHFVIFLPQQRNVLKQYFPNAPPLDDLIHNVSVILLNSHFSVVETPRPYMPNMIPVGGFHIQPQNLSKDLKDFLDGAKTGAVLFSLGSNVKSADLPAEKLDAILRTFSKLPLRFLWKFEEVNLKLPENVKVTKWLPQRAVLEHPNIKAFITHGGLLSITEAIYYGVPFIGVPAFGDQQYNILNAVRKKIAIEYDINSITEESFTAAIKEIIENSIYEENIATRSSLLRGQPVPPLELAIYWVEHVIKYRGTPHLKSAGVKLSWYQAYLLDVIAFLVAILSVVFYLVIFVSKKCVTFVYKKVCRTRKVKTV